MGGPFMQGVVLMGIIYWYSKAMLNLINDYYRSEFHQKLKRAPPEQKIHQLKAQSYDLDDMEKLIQMESLKQMELRKERMEVKEEVPPLRWIESELMSLNSDDIYKRCYRPSPNVEFFSILLQLCENYHAPGGQFCFSFNYPICLLDEKKKI